MINKKRKKLRLVNMVTFAVLALVSLAAFILPFNGNSVETMVMKYPNMLSAPSLAWYFYFVVLIALAVFTLYLASRREDSRNITGKALDLLGWTVPASFVLYSLAIALWHYEFLGLTIFLLVLLLIVQLILHGNIRDDADLMGEKLRVRIPFSLFLAWNLIFLLVTIAMRWQNVFRNETPAVILVVVFLLVAVLIAMRNRDITLAIGWIYLLLIKLPAFPLRSLSSVILWAGIAALAVTAVFNLLSRRHPKHLRKPVARGMDKFDYGRESQIRKLEDEINEKLQTRPGGRITYR